MDKIIAPSYAVLVPVSCRNILYFQEMLLSLLNQTIPPKEIHLIYDKNYIIDNRNISDYFACNDWLGTLSPGNTIIKETENTKKGISYTRNKGISELTNESGEFIFFCDDDDVWYEQKVEKQLDYALNTGNIGIIGTNFREIDENGNLICYSSYPQTKDKIMNYYNCPFKTSSVMMEREILLKTGGFDTRLIASEDTDFFLRVIRQFPDHLYNNLSSILMDYRSYTGNTSHKNWLTQRYNNLKVYNKYFFPKKSTEIIPYTQGLIRKVVVLSCTPTLRKLYLKSRHKNITPLPDPSIDLGEAQHPQISTEQ